jgi:hypothetical protein
LKAVTCWGHEAQRCTVIVLSQRRFNIVA